MTQELIALRDELYEALPTGEVHAFDLIKVIKAHIGKLDDLVAQQQAASGDDESHLYTFSELYGMAPNATGGLPAEDWIAQQRAALSSAVPQSVIQEAAKAFDIAECTAIRLEDDEYSINHLTFERLRKAAKALQPYLAQKEETK